MLTRFVPTGTHNSTNTTRAMNRRLRLVNAWVRMTENAVVKAEVSGDPGMSGEVPKTYWPIQRTG